MKKVYEGTPSEMINLNWIMSTAEAALPKEVGTDLHIHDVAVTAQMLQECNDYDSVLESVDRMYEMANAFIKKYPTDTKWGIDEDLEWEETISKFYTENDLKFRQGNYEVDTQ